MRGGGGRHAVWTLRLQNDKLDIEELISFLRAGSVGLEADFSCLTALSASEIMLQKSRTNSSWIEFSESPSGGVSDGASDIVQR
jgi:hypothetical protein